MTRISDRIRIEQPVDVVFDYIADSRNEPSYNPDMLSVAMLTEEPVRSGTRFRATMGRSGMQLLVTLTDFDRPRVLGSTTTSDLLDTAGRLTFKPDGDSATILAWDWQVQPKRWLRMLGPAFAPIGRRMERRIWTAARDILERKSATG
jgi:hypothetical protein